MEDVTLLTKEDKEMSLECITAVEKQFLNFVRNFRTQEWLKDKLLEYTSSTAQDLVERTIEDTALTSLRAFLEDEDVSNDEIYSLYIHAQELVADNENTEDIYDKWYNNVTETLESDLIPVEETNNIDNN